MRNAVRTFGSRFLHASLFFVAWVMTTCGLLGLAQGQVAIEASATQFAYDCTLLNNQGQGLRNVYILLGFNSGASAARFAVAPGPGATMVYISESSPYPSIGNTKDGISICFGSCLTGEPLIATVTFLSLTTDATCSQIRVIPHPGAETLEVRKCNGSTVSAYALDLQIVPPATMPCPCPTPHLFPGTPSAFDCTPVRTESTTWGHIKALYTN